MKVPIPRGTGELDSQGLTDFENVVKMHDRNVRLKSDGVLTAPSSHYDLGFRGKTVIVPINEIPLLHIDPDSPCSGLIEFWGIVVHDSFDVVYGIQMLTVTLYGPWGTFEVPEHVCVIVEDGQPHSVLLLQIWGGVVPDSFDGEGSHSDVSTSDDE